MQNRFPLDESGRGRCDLCVFLQINFLPLTPVAVRIVNVAAASEQFDTALTAKFRASPLREDVRVEDIAFVRAVGIGRTAQQKYLSQVASCGVKTAVSCSESGHLIGFCLGQFGVNSTAGDFEDLPLVSSPGEQATLLDERERIDQIFARGPKA